MLPPVVISCESVSLVSTIHRCTPGLGSGNALTRWRLSGSQLKGAAKLGEELVADGARDGASPLNGTTQNSGLANVLARIAHRPNFDPSGVNRTIPSKNGGSPNGGRVYRAGALPGGDD